MPYDGYPTRSETVDTLSGSFTYRSYEREHTNTEPLSSSKNYDVRHRSESEISVSSESKPIIQKRINTAQSFVSQTNCQKVLVMIACIFLQIAAFGLVVAFGVIYVELIDAFDASRADAALIQSIYMGATLGGGVLFTKVLERYNTGTCVVVASLIGTAALVGSAYGQNVATLLVLQGCILGIVMSCNNLASFVTVSRTFTSNRKFALGILTFGSTFGQIIVPFLTYALIDVYYWSGAVLVLSSMVVLNCVPCGLIIMASANTPSTDRDTIGDDESTSKSTTSLFKDSLFLFYVFMYLILQTFNPVEQWFSADLAVMKGFSFDEGSTLLSVNGGAGFAGRFLGSLMVKIFKEARPELYLIGAFCTWTVAHISIYHAPQYWLMVLAMVLHGLSAGLATSIIPAMHIELNGVEHFATTVAVCNFIGGAGEILGGYIGGYTVDVTGDYELIFTIASISAAFCALSLVVVYVVLRRRRKDGILH